MLIGIPKETKTGERRVAVVPQDVERLFKKGFRVWVEADAGAAAGYSNEAYVEAGARIILTKDELYREAEAILQVNTPAQDRTASSDELNLLRQGQLLLGMMNPLGSPERVELLAVRGVSGFAMELIPRISRAQSMDVLSSMATVAGYKSVLLAASHLPKLFPMLMTAAGSLKPARVLVLGAGVAGLQAIATAKRLGAIVEAYDVRPEVKEQVESVGGSFVEISVELGVASDENGYARSQSDALQAQQQALLVTHVEKADVVITTAAIPGRRAPILMTSEMVRCMRSGSVIVDLAAETGGNCEVTRPGETTSYHGVTIIGLDNLPGMLPEHSSQMYSRNITTLLMHLVKADQSHLIDFGDEIVNGTMVCREGDVVHPRLLALGRAAA